MGLLRRTSTPSLKTVTYLPPSTCHPKHVFKAILFGVATRLKRNCSEEIFLAERTAEYKGYLVNQGYPSKLVSDQFSKASAISRNDLLKTRGKETERKIPHTLDDFSFQCIDQVQTPNNSEEIHSSLFLIYSIFLRFVDFVFCSLLINTTFCSFT